jgi:phloretin hydrolase
MIRFRRRYLVLLISIVFVCSGFTSCQLEEFIYLNSKLTTKEKKMPESKYYNPEFAPLPSDVEAAFLSGPIDSADALQFEDINDLFEPGYLAVENGFCLNPDGTGFVAVKTYLPGATADMIQWWFWWHANKNIRYKIWCPGDHYAISVENEEQQNNKALTYEQRRVDNIHYPYEDTGSGVLELSIHFVSPETFGIDTSKFDEMGIEAVVCGIVGYMIGEVPLQHTKMIHVFRKYGNGLELRSRFWPGIVLPSVELRQLAITQDVVEDLAYHCSLEYNHLAEFLPRIYQEFKNVADE